MSNPTGHANLLCFCVRTKRSIQRDRDSESFRKEEDTWSGTVRYSAFNGNRNIKRLLQERRERLPI